LAKHREKKTHKERDAKEKTQFGNKQDNIEVDSLSAAAIWNRSEAGKTKYPVRQKLLMGGAKI